MKNSPRPGTAPPATKQKTARTSTVPGPQRLSSTDAGFRHRPGTERGLQAEGGVETGAQATADPAKPSADKAKPKTSAEKMKSARTPGPKTTSSAASSKMLESTLKQLEEAQKLIEEMKETFVCEAVRTEFTALQQQVDQLTSEKQAAEVEAQRQMTELKAEVEQLTGELREAKERQETSTATISKLKEENEELEKRAATAERTTQARDMNLHSVVGPCSSDADAWTDRHARTSQVVGAKKTSFEKEIYGAKAAKAKAEKAMERAQQELAANVAVVERLKQENAQMRVSLAEAARDHACSHEAPPPTGMRRGARAYYSRVAPLRPFS